ncbi:hypothetical protein O3M35_012918 [Rhynocoris fuscipes]|uniref:S-adenosylmethionine sensor upstream of mTORC1 n=1 Tax=Rhynocoris fuscipes TaxID=488301 RepID=A0AAW1CKU1_9HEMI
MAVPVLNTRQVLLDHLLAKVTPMCSSKLLAKEILLEIANNLQNKDILNLLQNDKLLFEVVNKSNACCTFSYKNEKQELGEELFYKISEIESDLCAKITGMLLELDTNTIKELINDEQLLSKAIVKAKKEYVEYTNQSKDREELGEKLYDLVCEKYRPEIASRLTGMILELDSDLIINEMANQQELSDFIKKVHIDLRLSSRQIGAESAWEEHCKKEDTLKKYAETMRSLATDYWDNNITNQQNVNRISWVVNECKRYFTIEEQRKIKDKQQRLLLHYFGEEQILDENIFVVKDKLNLLDVGSCYNPFKNFETFNVTAIDLAPASDDVLKCDFLEVKLGDNFSYVENSVTSLPKKYFDVVVLSLLLEYLPHPSFRYNCCLKAYELLRPGGILIIITPDSKHASANSQIIKNWRLALADIGFIKLTYNKSVHLHCMSYSKCIDQRITKNWLKLQNFNTNPKELMIIPQDNVNYQINNDTKEVNDEPRCENDNKIIAENFSLLAGNF